MTTLAQTVVIGLLILSLIWTCVAQADENSSAVKVKASTPSANVRPVVDAAKYFNAKSTTSGLQEAIDAVGPEGGTVVLPPGVYPIRRSLVLKSRVTLRGSGAATVLRKEGGFASPPVADIPSGATEVELKDGSGFRVGDEIGIRSPEENGWGCHHPIVTAVKGNRITFKPATKNSYKVKGEALVFTVHPAITAKDQSELVIENLMIDGNIEAQSADIPVDFTFSAIHLVRCWQSRVRDVWVTGWPSDGIGVQGGADDQVINCTARKCRGHGFHPGTSLNNAVFTGNVGRENGRDGLFFCMKVKHCTMSNNTFYGNGWSGIGGLGDAYDEWNVCSGNTCTANGRAGILMSDGKNNTVTGNVCVNNSQSEAGKYPGILIRNTTGSMAVGNRCSDDQKEPTQQVGIRESGKSDQNLITGNHLAGSKKGIEKVGEKTQVAQNLE